jgi:hypothetical protein
MVHSLMMISGSLYDNMSACCGFVSACIEDAFDSALNVARVGSQAP